MTDNHRVSRIVRQLRDYCTDWDGSPIADLAPTRTEPPCRELREAANIIAHFAAALAAIAHGQTVALDPDGSGNCPVPMSSEEMKFLAIQALNKVGEQTS